MIPPHADLTGPVRAFLKSRGPLSVLEAGHRSPRGCSAYAYHQKTYTFSVPAATISDALHDSTPEQLWVGDTRYQVSFDRDTGQVYVPGDDHPPLRERMVVVLDLRIIPAVHIPTAFELVKLDRAGGRVAFGYVRGNKSQGLQRLTIHEDDRRTARILHETWYDSGNTVRDRFFYPTFHERLMDRFYDNLRALAARMR